MSCNYIFEIAVEFLGGFWKNQPQSEQVALDAQISGFNFQGLTIGGGGFVGLTEVKKKKRA
jgi:hypothetical protein